MKLSRTVLVLVVASAIMGLAIAGCKCPSSSSGAAAEPQKPAVAAQPAVTPKPVETPKPVVVAQPKSTFSLRVNCGATAPYTDNQGRVWQADQEWAEGKTWGSDDGMTVDREGIGITGTDTVKIYEFERYSMGSYKFTVPNGKYTVRLHFCETYDGITAAGERVFSVSIDGKVVLKDLDVFKEVGSLKPLIKEFKGIVVANGQLVIGFTANIENPQINGIEIAAE